jgi:hypothetical protein
VPPLEAEVLDEFDLDIQIDETPARNNDLRAHRDPDTILTLCSCSWCCPTRPSCHCANHRYQPGLRRVP